MSERQKIAGLFAVLLGILFLVSVFRPRSPVVYSSLANRKTYDEIMAESRITTKVVRGLEYQNDADWKRGEYGNIVIAGSVKNESDKSYRYAQISFNLLDKNGNQIGNAFANVTGLNAGRTWKFEAMVISTENLHTFEFHEVKGW